MTRNLRAGLYPRSCALLSLASSRPLRRNLLPPRRRRGGDRCGGQQPLKTSGVIVTRMRTSPAARFKVAFFSSSPFLPLLVFLQPACCSAQRREEASAPAPGLCGAAARCPTCKLSPSLITWTHISPASRVWRCRRRGAGGALRWRGGPPQDPRNVVRAGARVLSASGKPAVAAARTPVIRIIDSQKARVGSASN